MTRTMRIELAAVLAVVLARARLALLAVTTVWMVSLPATEGGSRTG